ncbi:helix-turn-helix domain-containing protein [Paracoccus sp. M683]|uniref:DUF6456 domain-containing protein n=1 Tax=Paracoccus sp. M683 TaxID=2594268 RepID=UPI001180F9C4|nr:DUF6456 domain-containing protein [Paracoccus sp. M683]TRW96184.1 helix-turn-helix domain-containing protein [Paracoccus sp. M683]
MTILTGDFAFEAQVGGHRSPEGPAAEDGAVAALPEEAQLYLRHVEQGETIRAIARDLGCHASTILRRIRKYESRRDDLLVDGALERAGNGASLDGPKATQTLRRLAEPGALMAVVPGMEKAIVTRDGIRTAVLERELAEAMALNGWVAQVGQGRVLSYAISPTGREVLRGKMAPGKGRGAGATGSGAGLPRPQAFRDARPVQADTDISQLSDGETPDAAPDEGPEHAARHRIWSERVIRDPDSGQRRRTRVNIAESPLLILARRRDGNGQAFLSAGMVAAGERLREDFELAQLGPRTTQNWDGFMTAGIDVSRADTGYRGGSESARNRVAVALRELGPGMGDIVLRVCCFLEGIELTERRLGWSARSGKIVLRLALMRLERHYEETYGQGSRLIG